MTDSWRNSSTIRTARAPALFRARYTHTRAHIYTFMRGRPVGIGHEIIQDGVRESGVAHLPASLLFQVYALRRLTFSTYLREFWMAKLQQKSTLYLSLRAHASTNLNGRENEGFNSGPKQSASRITAPQNYGLLVGPVALWEFLM